MESLESTFLLVTSKYENIDWFAYRFPFQVVKENQKYIRAFVICLGQHNEHTFNVYYETEAVTAKRDKDYKDISDGVLTFVGNEYEKYIDVKIYDDMNEEKDETFNIHLTSSTGGKYYWL